MKFVDLTGKTFGRLKVLAHSFKKNSSSYWHCRCSCGVFKIIEGRHLKRGSVTSCGCYKREVDTLRFFKHGHNTRVSISHEYKAWRSMLLRCSSGLKRYEGRGIKVCKRWKKFSLFLKDVGYAPSPKHTLDRINNNGNYTKRNIRRLIIT